MNVDNNLELNDLELDALKEILNVSFGSAVADLADLLDIFINLSLPEVHVQDMKNFYSSLRNKDKRLDEDRVIYQTFHGQFEGAAFLIFPYGKEKELLSFFQNPDYISFESDELIELEMDALMEIGSILTGACVGRIFDFLESNISYMPPQAARGEEFMKLIPLSILSCHKKAVTMKTGFSFEDRETGGTLIILSYDESIPFLKKALSHFTE
jgi:chemotaxis protein CheC